MKITNFDFMAYRKTAFIISILTGILAIASLATKGLNLGLDFTGGTVTEVHFEKPVEVQTLRDALEKAGIHDAVTLHFGEATDILVRVPPKSESQDKSLPQVVMAAFSDATPDNKSTLRRTEFVGPQVGAELRDQSGIAMLLSLGFMMIYVTVRFQFKFGVGCVVSLFHDTLLTLGILSVFQITFDLTVLAAVLSLIGYSLNDSIVVSDRVRENYKKLRKGTAAEIINLSLNQTLARSIMTHVTVFLVVVALWVFGGEFIRGFSIAMAFGVVVGTFSSIFVVLSLVLQMGLSKEDFIQAKFEEVDERP